jgi:cell wall-associated NlpC family hydrolase
MRREPDFSSEMVSQGIMGMPVRVVKDSIWYEIETPDNYRGWVHPAAIHRVSREDLTAWNQSEKVVVTALYGTVYAQPDDQSQAVSDVVAGNRLRYDGRKGGFFKVSYPDGRTGYLSRKLAERETEWREQLKSDPASILQTARMLIGVPYLWAGTSPKGIDCSGFVRTILYMHDIIIPRDAWQQALCGDRIIIAPDCSNLQPGDLIFFGRKATADRKERVVHVGIYEGGGRFIHSQGDVRINSLLKDDPLFDSYNLGRLLYASRILPYINKAPELNTTLTNPMYGL